MTTTPAFTYPGITYVYVIYSTSGYFKIGISRDPDKRLKNIDRGTLTPFENKFLCLIPFPDEKAKTMEAYLHNKYAAKRVNGEWFRLDPFDIAFLVALETRLDDYWLIEVAKGRSGAIADMLEEEVDS